MIKISITDEIIKVKGHAKYDDAGKDIVCASVSSIIYTTVNGIFNIDKSAILFIDNDSLLEIKILRRSNVVNILINSMIDLLNNLSEQYPKNIKIDKGE